VTGVRDPYLARVREPQVSPGGTDTYGYSGLLTRDVLNIKPAFNPHINLMKPFALSLNSFGIVAAACAASLLSIAVTHAARPPGARVEAFAKLPDFLGNPADGWVTRLLRFCLPDRPAPQSRRFVSRV
jgi:hypothetical protein